MPDTALKEILGETLEAQTSPFFESRGLDVITEIHMFITQTIADSAPDWEYRMLEDGTIYRYAPKTRRKGTLQ